MIVIKLLVGLVVVVLLIGPALMLFGWGCIGLSKCLGWLANRLGGTP